MKKLLLILFFISLSLKAQVIYTPGEVLFDRSHFIGQATSIITADLNNDGYKELIVGTYGEDIIFYRNSNGDLQEYQRDYIYKNPIEYNYGHIHIASGDIDNDGLLDIIGINDHEDTVFWIKNLGNFAFGVPNIISSTLDEPISLAVADMDNDGYEDVLVGTDNDEDLSIFYNTNGNFDEQQILLSANHKVTKILIADMDNDGYLDIFCGLYSDAVYFIKNLDGANYSSGDFVLPAGNDGMAYDLVDINNDSYLDLITTDNYDDDLTYYLNMNGLAFDYDNAITITNVFEDIKNVMSGDVDNDGLIDVILGAGYNRKLYWLKNNGNGILNNVQLLSDIPGQYNYAIADLNEDSSLDIVMASSSSSGNSTANDFSVLFYDTANSNYNIVNLCYSVGAGTVVAIGDLNNDGKNDIVTCFKKVAWHKNKGSNEFSSQRILGDFEDNMYNSSVCYGVELWDLNNDNYLDVVSIENGVLHIYKNNGDETFTLEYSNEQSARDLEICDLNNDGNLDILIINWVSGGNWNIEKFMSNGGFSYADPVNVDYNVYGFDPWVIKSGDMDNDGDIDIVVGSKDTSRIQLLDNDGNGNLSFQTIQNSIGAHTIALGDLDNDGDLDIVTGGNTSSSNYVKWLKNNGGSFGEPVLIGNNGVESIILGDINNDGDLDIIATSNTTYGGTNERVYYYLNNATNFNFYYNVEVINQNPNLTRNAFVGYINNDNKLDIVSTYYMQGMMKVFYNTTALNNEIFTEEEQIKIEIYPNPVSDRITIDGYFKVSDIIIYDLSGKKMNCVFGVDNTVDVSLLKAGTYIITGSVNNSRFHKLFVKK